MMVPQKSEGEWSENVLKKCIIFEQLKTVWYIESIGSFLTVLVRFSNLWESHGPTHPLMVRRESRGPEKSCVCFKPTGQGRGHPHALVKVQLPINSWKWMKWRLKREFERDTNDLLGRASPGNETVSWNAGGFSEIGVTWAGGPPPSARGPHGTRGWRYFLFKGAARIQKDELEVCTVAQREASTEHMLTILINSLPLHVWINSKEEFYKRITFHKKPPLPL